MEATARVNQALWQEQKKADVDFYMDKWLSRTSDLCEVCGAVIHQPHTWNFHHLLPKAKYPLLRYDIDNVAIVCLQCHDQMHLMSGRITSFDNRIEELKQRIEN
jgi:5-methylcytosine-specific restriction endonuclease McrA